MGNKYEMVVTTQGPTYPPSEVMDKNGNFIVIGTLNLTNNNGNFFQEWGGAIVSTNTPLPKFGNNIPYTIIKRFNWRKISKEEDCVLYSA